MRDAHVNKPPPSPLPPNLNENGGSQLNREIVGSRLRHVTYNKIKVQIVPH